MKLIGDLTCPAGKYNDPQTGEEKTRWMKCGVVLENAEGELRVKLEAIPVGVAAEGGLWFSVFKRDQRPNPQRPQRAPDPDPSNGSEVERLRSEELPW